MNKTRVCIYHIYIYIYIYIYLDIDQILFNIYLLFTKTHKLLQKNTFYLFPC